MSYGSAVDSMSLSSASHKILTGSEKLMFCAISVLIENEQFLKYNIDEQQQCCIVSAIDLL